MSEHEELTEAAVWQRLYEQELAKNNNTTLRQLEEMVQRQRLAEQEEKKAERQEQARLEAIEQEARAFVAEVKLGRIRWGNG